MNDDEDFDELDEYDLLNDYDSIDAEEAEYFFMCPYCWQEISMLFDLSTPEQEYIEDCEICCNPIQVYYTAEDGAIIDFSAQKME